MPVTQTAKRALRKSRRRAEKNKKIKNKFKDLIKKTKKSQDPKETSTLIAKTSKALDKAAKKKVIHPNKAARLKSRLAKRVSKAPLKSKSKTNASKD